MHKSYLFCFKMEHGHSHELESQSQSFQSVDFPGLFLLRHFACPLPSSANFFLSFSKESLQNRIDVLPMCFLCFLHKPQASLTVIVVMVYLAVPRPLVLKKAMTPHSILLENPMEEPEGCSPWGR